LLWDSQVKFRKSPDIAPYKDAGYNDYGTQVYAGSINELWAE